MARSPILLLPELEIARRQRRQVHRSEQDFLRMRWVGVIERDLDVAANLDQGTAVVQRLERRVTGVGEVDDMLKPARLGGFIAERGMEHKGIVVMPGGGIAGRSILAGTANGAGIELEPLPLDIALLVAWRQGNGIGGLAKVGERRRFGAVAGGCRRLGAVPSIGRGGVLGLPILARVAGCGRLGFWPGVRLAGAVLDLGPVRTRAGPAWDRRRGGVLG